jgi:hypothetical protein
MITQKRRLLPKPFGGSVNKKHEPWRLLYKYSFTLLENIEIPVLGGIPKIPKLFDFGLILADYGSFKQPYTPSGRFWQFSKA